MARKRTNPFPEDVELVRSEVVLFLPPEVLEEIKIAAIRAKVTLGQWIAQAAAEKAARPKAKK